MAAWAPAAARAESAPLRRSRSRARVVPQRRLAGGVLWISLLAVLLTGVVALNVAVLRLNMRLEQLGRERASLRAENAELASQLSSSGANPRIESLARRRLGLVPADPALTTYIELGR